MWSAPKIEDLRSESDVEQKLILPLLISPPPQGLGLPLTNILTKTSIRELDIGKHRKRREFRPDYVVSLRAVPLLAIEAKNPADKIEDGLDDARMYANEVNALFPHKYNPIKFVVASNGHITALQHVDEAEPFLKLTLLDFTPGSASLSSLIDTIGSAALDRLFAELGSGVPLDQQQALSLLNSQEALDSELIRNTFGEQLTIDFRPLFTPDTRKERTHIARNAYIRSQRRDRYTEEIDKVIRHSTVGVVKNARELTDTGDPTELFEILRRGTTLENQIVVLVGSRGVGKTTFVDHLVDVSLPPDIGTRTVWSRLNLNVSPKDRKTLESWVVEHVLADVKESLRDLDIYSHTTLKAIFAKDLQRIEGALMMLKDEAARDAERAKFLISMTADDLRFLKALSRHLSNGFHRLLTVVFDNCDKRDAQDQLLMFEVARWLQSEISCLMVVPLRDITFERFRNVPPLDTTNKHYVFHIDPPPFSKVLRRRLHLVLEEVARIPGQRQAEFRLRSGMRVTFPRNELGSYLKLIYDSIFDSGLPAIRSILSGLAGRDIRRALEIFMDVCRSGHVDESFFLKLKTLSAENAPRLSQNDVMNVLLRKDRQFYSERTSFVLNMFEQTSPNPVIRCFPRIYVLQWLAHHYKLRGKGRERGFHQCTEVIEAMRETGLSDDEIWDEIQYLVNQGAILTELQSVGSFREVEGPVVHEKSELICISASGIVLLRFCRFAAYLAACAESTYVSTNVARRIAERIVPRFAKVHLGRCVQASNAHDFFKWVVDTSTENDNRRPSVTALPPPDRRSMFTNTIDEARVRIQRLEHRFAKDDEWSKHLCVGALLLASCERKVREGWIVRILGGPKAHMKQIDYQCQLKFEDLNEKAIVVVSPYIISQLHERLLVRLHEKI